MRDPMSVKMKLAQLHSDIADVMIVAISAEETVIEVNRKGCEILGYTKAEIMGKNWFDNFIPQKMRDKIRPLFHQMLKGTIPLEHYENPVLTKQGEERIISWHNILITDEAGNAIGTLSSGADVTEQKQVEKALRESEERFRSTLDGMLEGCQIIDYNWRYAYVNKAAARQGRRVKEELLGHTMMEMYPGIDRTEMFGYLQRCMANRISHQMENEFTFPDGSKGWFELRIEPVPEGVLILSLDITKRKELEEELNKYRHRLEGVVAERTAECAKANEQLIQEIEAHRKVEEGLMLRAMILDNAREAIFLVNSKGDFAYANEAASKTYGYTRDEFLNMNLRQLLRQQDAHLIDSRLKEVFEKGQLELETIQVKKDKTLMPVQVRHSLIRTLHGQFIVSVMRDITS